MPVGAGSEKLNRQALHIDVVRPLECLLTLLVLLRVTGFAEGDAPFVGWFNPHAAIRPNANVSAFDSLG